MNRKENNKIIKNCSTCQRDLSGAEIKNSYDEGKDLAICFQCYQKEGADAGGKYKDYNISHNPVPNSIKGHHNT